MKENVITFKTQGYDPSIDFIKGLCILFVVWTHCFGRLLMNYSLFDLWGYPAVTVFLLIQVFHSYKKGLDNVKVSLLKLWDRIIKPFALVMTAILGIKLMFSHQTAWEIIKGAIKAGGFGPGSYYPYIYVQFALIPMLLVVLFKKINNIHILGLLFIAGSVLFEAACSLIEMPVWIYRLLCFRYLFIVFLGYLLANNRLKINVFTIILSLISAVFIMIIRFNGYQFSHFPEFIRNFLIPIFDFNLEPFFYMNGWPQAHWICYFWDSYLYLFLLLFTYKLVQKFDSISNIIQQMGKYSYEIFLVQMFYFTFSEKVMNVLRAFFDNNIIVRVLLIVISTIVCISVVLVWKKIVKNIPISPKNT